MIHHLEILESRQLLTNLVAVSVAGGAVDLTDAGTRRVSTGDAFTVSYTSSQMVLTGQNGTEFVVGGQTMPTFTATVTGTLSLAMSLNDRGNSVTITGDGTADLSSLTVDLGVGRQDNSLFMSKVVADSVNIDGGRRDDSVTMSQCTVNDNLTVNLGQAAGDFLGLDTTTVKGNVSDHVSQLVMNHSTITGTLSDVESRRNSSFNSTDSTYTGAAAVQMGRNGIVNMLSATDGPSAFKSSVAVSGNRHRPTVIIQQANAVTYAVKPTLTHASIEGSPASVPTTVAAPTVVSQTVPSTTTPVITGTFDSTAAPNLSVTAGGKTYKLGTDAQLTSPSAGKWSLNLAGATLTAPLTVTATNSDNSGGSKSATGTIATDQQAITAYLTANHLTATTTADGLNYVITTQGTGALPHSGQTVTAKYAGFIVNADGTLGSEFDHNSTGFPFTLGAGQVIAGWDEGFALLPVGTVGKLLIPSALAYGTTGKSPIPPNAVLEFDVTVVSAV